VQLVAHLGLTLAEVCGMSVPPPRGSRGLSAERRTDSTRSTTYRFPSGERDIEPRKAEFVFAFCTASIVQMESGVGSLDAPYGSDRWYQAIAS